jgi:hypothetical protein
MRLKTHGIVQAALHVSSKDFVPSEGMTLALTDAGGKVR